MYKHILLATGGAEHSRIAETRAVALAKLFSARLSLISVARFSLPASTVGVGLDMGMPVSYETNLEELKKSQEDTMQQAVSRCEALGIHPEAYLAVGNAGECIVEKARDLGCDLTIVGSRKMSLLDTVVRGSVSDYVMRHSEMDVLIVH
ncbi:MAG: universal stress protein [Trueperaceae bacterium]|nr:universal stress protein [Trueperaceae bacterium]